MLFLMVMNALQPIGHQTILHQCSLYADDAILFITPTDQDVAALTAILHLFGQASGLHTNMSKCMIVPISCLDLRIAGFALRLRWLWFQRTDTKRPWSGLPLECEREVQAMFDASIEITTGDGKLTFFLD